MSKHLLQIHLQLATDYASLKSPGGKALANAHIRKALGLANTAAPSLKPTLLRCLNYSRRATR